jgi:hypothetical protein
MPSSLAPGKVRIYAVAGVGGLIGGRWHDVAPSPRLEGWLAAGLVKATGPKGEAPPNRLSPACCGARDR